MLRKIQNKIFQRSFLAFSNVGRGLLVGTFGLVLNFLLIRLESKDVLNTYVYFIAFFGLFYNFINWGGKFFYTKEISKNQKKSKKLTSDLISSKVILLVLLSIIIAFLSIEIVLKLLLIVLLFLKSFSSIFDSLIIFYKKSNVVLAFEIFFNTIFLLFIYASGNLLAPISFLTYFLLFEFLKFIFFLIFFWNKISFEFSFNNGYNILKKSFYFFCVSIAGFIVSKADLYIIGILINKDTMSIYFIISSLASITMVIYANLINTFSTSIYRFSKKMFKKLESSLKIFGLLFSILATIGFFFIVNIFYKINIDFKFSILFFFNIFLFTLLNFEMYRFTKNDKQKIILLFLVVSGIANCVFSFLFIKELLLFGALLSNSLSILVNLLMFRLYLIKKLQHES